MDYEIFRKQVYRGTGGQRDSSLEVTDSIQREIEPGVVSVYLVEFNIVLPFYSNRNRRTSAQIGRKY
jgi:hypothetical protein